MSNASIKPYKIAVPDSALESLKVRLDAATLPDDFDFSEDRDYGAPLADVKRLVTKWKDGFDWRAQEAKLNELPHFTTDIAVDGFGSLNVHFVHQKSAKPGSIPLLFCHGWPGSFIEVVKILPLLTNSDSGPSFHVVAPSLPNFGFSDAVRKPGFGIPQYAETMHKVMLALGYDKYVTQGGDWGYNITRLMGLQFPDHCVASHINLILARKPPQFTTSPLLYLKHALTSYTTQEKQGRERSAWFMNRGYGYNLEQGTKPSTLGFSLADSPVGMLAWIYEKLRDWTDEYPWTDDEVLTWISIYQFSKAGANASVRIYYESRNAEQAKTLQASGYIPRVLLGQSYFPKDLAVTPLVWGRALGPVVFQKAHADGGHFAAYERPKELVEDLQAMFGKGGGAYSVTQSFKAKL